jgi:hypothetical protein
MKILGLPISNIATASSRIRCFRFLQFLPKDIVTVIGDENSSIDGCDIVFIQKRAYRHTIDFAKRAKSKGVKIVYDIDDDFGCWENMFEKEMCDLADLVVTDTQERVEWLQERTKTAIEIVPDGIDYLDAKPNGFNVRDSISSVFTFGSNNGVFVATEMFNKITGLEKNYYCSKPILSQGIFSRWNLSTFVNSISKHDLAILAHDGNNSGFRKSNNRLIVCMSLGIPALVSDTPAYSKTMIDVGCEKLIKKNIDGINDQIRSLSKEDRVDISNKFISYSWANFSPEKSSLIFLEKIRKYA